MRVKNFLQTAAHKHRDADVRLSWVQAIDDPPSAEAASIIDELALSDESVTVRRAAIAQVRNPDTLAVLLEADGDQSLIDVAEERLGDLLDADALGDEALSGLLEQHGSRIAHTVAVRCKQAPLRERALALMNDEVALLHVVQQSRYHDTRQQAADRLVHHDALRAALTACRSRDKVVAKSLQTRLDAEAAAEADRIATRHAVTTTLTGMRTLAGSVWSPQHSGRHQALLERWQSLESARTADEQAEFDALSSRVAESVEQHAAEQAARHTEASAQDVTTSATASSQTATMEGDPKALNTPSALEARSDTAHPEATSEASSEAQSSASASAGASPDQALSSRSVVPEYSDEWKNDEAVQALVTRLVAVELEALPTAIDAIGNESALQAAASSERGRTLLAHAQSIAVMFDPPFDDLKARPSALTQRIKRLDALLDTGATLGGMPLDTLVYLTELQAHRDLLLRRLEKARQDSSDRVKATHRQFAALSGMVSDGKWGPASSMLRRLQKKLSAMEPAERTGLSEKLERAEKQVSEMADWQDFASRPKLEALCEDMEALPGKELAPGALAKQVRELQAQWKAMGPSRAANELWSRFKTAGDTAYEPCKAWFEQKQQERKQKLEAKATICAALEALHPELEAEAPDWKALARKVMDARRDWSRNRVPGRKPDKALETRFTHALKPIEEALKVQYDANAAEKQALIDKVAALAQSEITQHTANQARSLQSAWKQVGVMRRKEDQALWEVFNEHCRVIFKQRNEADREKRHAALGHVFRAKDIIKRLRQLSKGSSVDESEVQALATEFQGLADFPERDRKFLQRDFRGAMDAVARIQETTAKRRDAAEYEERLRLVELCEQLELAVENPSAAVDTLRDDVTHAWQASDIRVPREIMAALESRRDAALVHLDKGSQPDYDANEESRRDLLVQMEVAAGVDTPPEDKMRRMTYQLANLQEGMTSGSVSDKASRLRELSDQWLASPPVRISVRDALNSRYLKATGR